LFRKMDDRSIPRDTISFEAAISACKAGHLWVGAVSLLEDLQRDAHSPNALTFSTVISACVLGREWEVSFRLWDAMVSSAISPNVMTYTAVLGACEAGLQWTRALSFLGDIYRASIEPDQGAYVAVLLALIGVSEEAAAQRIYLEAVTRGIWTPKRRTGELDLHRLPVEVAKIAVRNELLQQLSVHRTEDAKANITLITGRGNNNEEGEALVREALLEMLQCELHLPGSVAQLHPTNPGRILVNLEGLVQLYSEGSGQ